MACAFACFESRDAESVGSSMSKRQEQTTSAVEIRQSDAVRGVSLPALALESRRASRSNLDAVARAWLHGGQRPEPSEPRIELAEGGLGLDLISLLIREHWRGIREGDSALVRRRQPGPAVSKRDRLGEADGRAGDAERGSSHQLQGVHGVRGER